MGKIIQEIIPVILNTIAIYLFLILALRLLGRRQTSDLSVVELAIVMVLGSSVETAMVAGDKSLLAGLVAAATILAANRVLSLLLHRWTRLRRILLGRPIPLVYKGQFLTTRMRQAGLNEDDVCEGLRERGYADVSQVRLAMLEIDGAISVLPLDTGSDDSSSSGKKKKA